MGDWTPATVDARLESAADVFSMLPEVKPQGYFNAWPEYFHSFADKVGQQPQMRRPRPSPREITQAEETMLWLRWLDPDDARLLWLRANRTHQPDTVEADLLGTRHQPCNGEPTLAVRHRRHRLAAERKASARETVHGVRCGSSRSIASDLGLLNRRNCQLSDGRRNGSLFHFLR